MPVHPDPWPGESLTYYDAMVTAPTLDTQLWRDVGFRDHVGRTITSGDVWKVWYEADTAWSDRYLDDPTADVVVSWVVEVNSGTGTLAASEGVHASFPNASDSAPTSLGSYPVAGASTVVIGSALMTAAEVVDSGPFYMVRLECTSGSLDVQQVKLRVWPVGGAVGGWSEPKPSWTDTPSNATILYTNEGAAGTGFAATPTDAYAAAADDFAANLAIEAAPQARGMSTIGTGMDAQQQTSFTGGGYTSLWNLGAILAVVHGADWAGHYPIDTSALVEGVDWTRPPDEVPGDYTNLVQQIGDGSVGWLNAIVRVTPDDPPTMPGTTLLYADSGDYGGPTYILPIPDTGTAISAEQVVALPTTGHDIFFAVTHTMPESYPGGTTVTNFYPGDGDDIQTYPILPPYRVWTPTAVVEVIRKVRQFHRDDGLGVTPPRAFGGASRIRTGRAYGYD